MKTEASRTEQRDLLMVPGGFLVRERVGRDAVGAGVYLLIEGLPFRWADRRKRVWWDGNDARR